MEELYLNKMISRLYRRNQSYLNKLFKELELPLDLGQCPALMQVYKTPGISQEGIVQETSLDKGTIARAIRQLEENQMVIRENDEKDKRMYRIYPTKKALEHKQKIIELFEKLHDILYQDCSKEEIRMVHRILFKMWTNLEKEF